MTEESVDKSNNWFLFLIGFCCLAVIATSFYFFYFKKDYSFLVESPCDPTKDVCIQRDCTNPDDCPPNQLSVFKRYSLNAGDFKRCENEDCTKACETGVIECELLECVEDLEYGETCTSVPDMSNIEIEDDIPNIEVITE